MKNYYIKIQFSFTMNFLIYQFNDEFSELSLIFF